MHRKSPHWLEDISDAAEHVLEWTAGLTLAVYDQDVMLRFAVERNFEIMGEALRRLERSDPPIAARIDKYRDVIDFRNLLAHGYDTIDNGRVWQYIATDLPRLRAQAAALLEEADAEFGS